jgi:predicted alpha/beta hydrolase
VRAAKDALPEQPLYLIGHSLGAQLPGLFEQPDRVDGLFSVAAGSGYWRDNAPRLRRSVLYFWHVLVPVATRVCGYFPGRSLRKVGDLPAGVIRQWRRWCLHPRYSVGAEGAAVAERYAQARFPLLAWSFTDDELMTLRGTRALVGLYPNAPSEVHTLGPEDVLARRIGHFGMFREHFRTSLWPRAVEALQALGDAGVAGMTANASALAHTTQP